MCDAKELFRVSFGEMRKLGQCGILQFCQLYVKFG